MDEMTGMKETLHRYLRSAREGLVWKVEGVDEYDAHRPLTSTGTNLLGLVQHLAWVEAEYFGACFGAPFDEAPGWDWEAPGTDPNIDLVAEQGREEVLDLYHRACAWADRTIGSTDLTATGTVPWWTQERRHPSLHAMLVHMTSETHRHAGHADILREGLDGRVGAREGDPNTEGGYDWPAHVARVQEVADRFR